MSLRLYAWSPPTMDAFAALLRALLPGDGFLALGGPDAAKLVDRADAGDELWTDLDRWLWGRAFSPEREVLWRCEGERRHVVAASPDDLDPALLDGGVECLAARSWTPVEHGDLRPGRLLLWPRDQQRLPRPPDYPRSLDGEAPPAIEIQEYDGPEGVAWCRYPRVVEG